MQDRAFWITWYDLPEQGREEYLDWCHRTYMPKVQSRAGVLWGAHYASENNVVPLGGGNGMVSRHAPPADLPDGDRYILIFGATESHVFMQPGPSQFHASLPERDRRMLAMRIPHGTAGIPMEESRQLLAYTPKFGIDLVISHNVCLPEPRSKRFTVIGVADFQKPLKIYRARDAALRAGRPVTVMTRRSLSC